MKPITPASYQQMFPITAGTGVIAPHRAILLQYTSAPNSIGIKFWDNTGVTLGTMGSAGTSEIFPIIAKQVISLTGITAYGML
jgi:hypothetical protein